MVNVNSPRYINTVVGHEITHVLEGSKLYDELEAAVIAYAKEKGTYRDVVKATYDMYSGVEGYTGAEGHRKIKQEAVANMVGDYLFTDKNFINRLATKSPNIFQKMWDEIKYMVKLAAAGSNEKKKLIQVQKAFEDAYREVTQKAGKAEQRQEQKNTADGGVKYSLRYLAAETNTEILEMVTRVIDGDFSSNSKVHLGVVPDGVAKTISGITGIDVQGFDMAIEARMVDHILKGHGKNGDTDHSMQDPKHLARIQYVLFQADDIRDAGRTSAYTHFKNGKSRPAPTVLYEKSIGEKSYYVVQAVPDTKAKTLYVVSAFIGPEGYKKEASQLINAQGPDATANTDSVVASKNSIRNPEPDVKGKFSLRDADYMDAVKRGDMKTAQKMADEAAKAAGYTVKAYHGTDADTFTVFDKGKIGEASGLSILGDGFYFSDKKSVAAQYGKNVYTVYLKQQNPYSATDSDTYKLNALKLATDGFDGVTLQTGKGTIYMVLDPEQIKSADPVTYDDDGNVIPLSERFKAENDDTRYSLSNGDVLPMRQGNYHVAGEEIAFDDLLPMAEAWDQTKAQIISDVSQTNVVAEEELLPMALKKIAERFQNSRSDKAQNLQKLIALEQRYIAEFSREIAEKEAQLAAMEHPNSKAAKQLRSEIEQLQQKLANVEKNLAKRQEALTQAQQDAADVAEETTDNGSYGRRGIRCCILAGKVLY